MIKLKTAISLFALMGLFSFTSKDIHLNDYTLRDSKDMSAELLKNELKSNKGQIVLISFWASYDAASRIENIKCAHLMKTFQNEKFNEANGFTVISVSMDSYRSIFEETVKRDGLDCVQNIQVTQGLHSKIASNYNLGNSLGNLLLNAQGKVIAKNLSAKEIEKILESKQIN